MSIFWTEVDSVWWNSLKKTFYTYLILGWQGMIQNNKQSFILLLHKVTSVVVFVKSSCSYLESLMSPVDALLWCKAR